MPQRTFFSGRCRAWRADERAVAHDRYNCFEFRAVEASRTGVTLRRLREGRIG